MSLSVAGSIWGKSGAGTRTVVGIRMPSAGKKRVDVLTLIGAVNITILMLAISSVVIAFFAAIGYVAVYNLADEKWRDPVRDRGRGPHRDTGAPGTRLRGPRVRGLHPEPHGARGAEGEGHG